MEGCVINVFDDNFEVRLLVLPRKLWKWQGTQL